MSAKCYNKHLCLHIILFTTILKFQHELAGLVVKIDNCYFKHSLVAVLIVDGLMALLLMLSAFKNIYVVYLISFTISAFNLPFSQNDIIPHGQKDLMLCHYSAHVKRTRSVQSSYTFPWPLVLCTYTQSQNPLSGRALSHHTSHVQYVQLFTWVNVDILHQVMYVLGREIGRKGDLVTPELFVKLLSGAEGGYVWGINCLKLELHVQYAVKIDMIYEWISVT